MTINQAGNALGVTALAAGATEFCRATLAPTVHSLYAFQPPITPQQWEQWWPLISSIVVSLTGLWTILGSKLNNGLKAQIEVLSDKLNEHISKGDARHADVKSDINIIKIKQEEADIRLAEHAKMLAGRKTGE